MKTCDWSLPNEYPLKSGGHPCGKRAEWRWNGSNRRGRTWTNYYCSEHYQLFDDADRPEWQHLHPQQAVKELKG